MKLNCIVTDDEPIAVEILEKYINLVPELNLIAKCQDAIETFSILKTNQVDVLFIDIQMPGISGLEFIRSLKNPPSVVFTTAFPDYAVSGFDLNAIDYLLKPIEIERFLSAVDKIFSKFTYKPLESSLENVPEKKFFFIKTNKGLIRVDYDKILYVEGLENYIRIHTEERDYISLSTMKNIEDMLSPHHFLRIHKSFIVNLEKVDSIHNSIFKMKDKELSTGRNYKKSVLEVLKDYFIEKKEKNT